MIEERYELALSRVSEIIEDGASDIADEAMRDYALSVCRWIQLNAEAYEQVHSGRMRESDLQVKSDWNRRLYAEVLGDCYNSSYKNPSYAVDRLGMEDGRILSAVYAELDSLTAYAYEDDLWNILIRIELAIQVYGLLSDDEVEHKGEAAGKCLASFAYDYLEDFMDGQVSGLVETDNGLADRIMQEADLTDLSYLYEYGEYISDNELKLATYMNSLSEEEIERMASTYTEGYRMGFVMTGKDISIKETVEIRYFIGFERMVRAAVRQFADMGLKASLRRAEPSFVRGRSSSKVGYFSTIANRQFEADHEYDKAIYFQKRYMERKLEAYRNALERHRLAASYYGGPAVIECFGEPPFCPEAKDTVIKPDDDTRARFVEYASRAGELVNQYIKGEEKSFTIIAFPIPAIGDRFPDIFRETIAINTLDYKLYQSMQQKIIDRLDTADYVHVRGMNGNETDMYINLWKLKDPEHETIFENCVADVNIPVGEVFTSPVLEGTHGTLHVKYVYLEGRPYSNLKLTFQDGRIVDYTCDNYKDEAKNKNYLKEHLLYNHDTLPIGEFAIGTNTVAYTVTKKYGLESVMPILIAEKTGPHFAVGDTCYSHEEDVVTYNPDGKAIVARENSVSALRKTDPLKAYLNCHTDITIPYDELGYIKAVGTDGRESDIIVEGRFALEGLEELNRPLDNM